MQPSEGSPPAEDHGVAQPMVDHVPDDMHEHLPPPSIWPVTTAFGVALGGFGLVTELWFSLAGLLIMGFGLFNWVQELRHAAH